MSVDIVNVGVQKITASIVAAALAYLVTKVGLSLDGNVPVVDVSVSEAIAYVAGLVAFYVRNEAIDVEVVADDGELPHAPERV